MLAIVIPYYKKAFFFETLQSLASQTDKRFRVYIGNDASPEDPENQIDEYAGSFPIRYRRFDENLGGKNLPLQWKRCMELIDTESWIMILGDDDVLGANVVASFYERLTQGSNVNVFRFATQKIDASSQATSVVYTHPELESSRDFLFRESRSSLSEYIFKREKLLENPFRELPLGWYSDVLAVLEVSNFGNVATINEAIVKVRISNQSISGSDSHDKPKLKARAIYYSLLCGRYLDRFLPSQQEMLFDKLERTYFARKADFLLLLQLFWLYLRKGRMARLSSIIRKVLGSFTAKIAGNHRNPKR